MNGGATDSYGVGFIQGLGSKEETGDVQSGSQSVGLWYVDGLTQNQTSTAASGIISGTTLKPADKIDICVSDDTRYATITLGTNNNQLSVNVNNHGETNEC